MARAAIFLAILTIVAASPSRAGQAPLSAATSVDAAPESIALPAGFDGPPPPALPQTIARSDTGRTTVRAVRITTPLKIDGRLDEAAYGSVQPLSGFIQTDPSEGEAATETTDVWIFYDRDNIYVSARCWETHPERLVVTELRRDSQMVFQNDNFSFILDTFNDHRNGLLFIINPLAGRMEGEISNERQVNRDWNPVWDVKTGRFEGGWTVEAAVPFKSIRYRPGRSQVWGFNARRVNKWKNELSHLTPIPRALSGTGLWHTSLAATMVGLEAPPGAKNLTIKPYALSDIATDRNASPRISNDVSGDVGVDVKYGVTQNLTADLTLNTDFAQAEADEQQVNLTRFSLFFPEKRDFFLENAGLFGFGGNSGFSTNTDVPVLFYSRRIGLNQGRVVPIDGGGRLTGRIGRYSLGLLDIQTDDERLSNTRPTNFSVLRLKRDLLRKSNIGMIFTGRSVDQAGISSNQAWGADGTFGFFNNLNIYTYWARTHTERRTGDDISYRAQLDYGGDRYGAQLERLVVGTNFNPEVGFVRRPGMLRSFGYFRFSPRPKSSKRVRRYSFSTSLGYLENGAGRLEQRDVDADFSTEFHNSDRFTAGYSGTYEFLQRPFRIATGVILPVGGYHYGNGRIAYNFGNQRKISGNASIERGPFYNGDRTTVAVTSGRANPTPQLTIEPTLSINWVDLDQGNFTAKLVGSRVTYTPTPLMFASALLQYNSGNNTVSANVRLRWEYRPGSELFVVYNQELDTRASHFPDLTNRSFIVKINRLLRF